MGTEIFPLIIIFVKILIGIVCALAVFITVTAGIQLMRRNIDPTKREELKSYILNALIAFTITVIVYIVLIGIGPAFDILFIK